MHTKMWLLSLLVFSAQSAFAQAAPGIPKRPIFEVVPELMAEQTRHFQEPMLREAQQTLEIHTTARDLVAEYSADAPFELLISFPFQESSSGQGRLLANPLHSLRVPLEPSRNARVSVDLSRSPAWSPWRDMYVVTIVGMSGSSVLLHDVSVRPPSALGALRAAWHHLGLDEPVLLSSVNFLWGYRVLDASFTVLLGVMFLILAVGFSFPHFAPGATRGRQVSDFRKKVLLLSLFFLLLYDARFSLDLLRTTATDLRQWSEGEYRQLGPLHDIASSLRKEREKFGPSESIALCSDGTDLLEKQLKYLLYPTPVEKAEHVWGSATHAVLIDTDRGSIALTTSGKVTQGAVSCGMGLQRPGSILQQFSQGAQLIRFTDAR